jgi:heme exporter protein C
MKYVKIVLMLAALVGPTLMHAFPSLVARTKLWVRWFTVVSILVTILIAILPPISGTRADAVFVGRADSMAVVPVAVKFEQKTSDSTILVTDVVDGAGLFRLRGSTSVLNTIQSAGGFCIVSVQWISDAEFRVLECTHTTTLFTLPYVLSLGELARLLFFHVPMAFVAMAAYALAMIFGVRYLKHRQPHLDVMASSAASVGTLFTLLAMLTGAVWAKFAWGTFWNWDPKQTAIFISLLLYVAYFVLRVNISDSNKRAEVSAAYAIVAFPTVLFLLFALPRMMAGLHPGSADSENAGPLLSMQSNAINPMNAIVYSWALFSFMLLFYWIVNLRYRIGMLRVNRS